MIDLSGKKPITVGYVETGRSYLDGALMIEAMDGIVRNRLRMSFNGHVAVAVIIDEDDEPLSDVWVACHGLANPRGGSLDEIVEGAVSQTLSISSSRTVMDDDHLEKAIIKSVRNSVGEAVDKKPEVSVLISRLMV
jgi:ribonuclease J